MSGMIEEILLIIALLVFAYVVIRIANRRMQKAREYIVADLKKKRAVDYTSAVELSYSKNPLLRAGLKDFRPQALDALIKEEVVRMLDGGRYFLLRDPDIAEETSSSIKPDSK
jgi:hypothetical protein